MIQRLDRSFSSVSIVSYTNRHTIHKKTRIKNVKYIYMKVFIYNVKRTHARLCAHADTQEQRTKNDYKEGQEL